MKPSRLKSEHKSALPNYFSRREQTRLLFLVGSFMLVLILAVEAGKPSRWYWLWGGRPPAENHNGSEADLPFDTRIPRQTALAEKQMPNALVVTSSARGQESGDSYRPEGEFFKGIRPELIGVVEDDRPIRRAKEAVAWDHLWEILSSANATELQNASLGSVGFLAIMRQAEFYRGKLITVSGRVRRLVKFPPDESASNETELFECWLQPDGSSMTPLLIYTKSLPDGFPVPGEIDQYITTTGFFYKRRPYIAKDGNSRSVPVILASSLIWSPAILKETRSLPATSVLVIAGIFLVGISGLFTWLIYRASNHRIGRVTVSKEGEPDWSVVTNLESSRDS